MPPLTSLLALAPKIALHMQQVLSIYLSNVKAIGGVKNLVT